MQQEQWAQAAPTATQGLTLVIPVYDGLDLLDAMGPYEMFKWVDASLGLNPVLISQDGAPVTSMNDVTFEVHGGFADYPAPDILWVPGGNPQVLAQIMSDPGSPYLAYLRQVAPTATWVCSVCEGALLAAQAGLLDGHSATTHWAFIGCLQEFPQVTVAPGTPRFIVSGNRLTGGGISSGLDEALALIQLLYGTLEAQSVQVSTQYFPDPPVRGVIPPTPACMITW